MTWRRLSLATLAAVVTLAPHPMAQAPSWRPTAMGTHGMVAYADPLRAPSVACLWDPDEAIPQTTSPAGDSHVMGW